MKTIVAVASRAATDPAPLMQLGIEQASLARRAFRQLNLHMLNAGVAFIRARDAATDFAALVESYKSQISRASVYRYMAYAEAILAQATEARPDLAGSTDLIIEYARDMVIQSPRPLVAVLRADGALRKFGQYDAVRYQRRKLGMPRPIVIRWPAIMDHLDALTRISDASVRIAVPDGTNERESLRVLRDRLQSALHALDQHLSTMD